ncbi:MAG: hypothetical protein IPO66_00280 [Rhodanobacteraceae bacterium]|nr:hypothetical protein [Rhodanobacteraceae bacterium]
MSGESDETRSGPMFGPMKSLLFLAVLWLPLSFFVWFNFAQLWVQPIAGLAGQVMGALFDGSFARTELTQHQIDFYFRVVPEGLRPVELGFDVNPMIYGYCIPVLVGLVMATPLSHARRALQIGVSLVVLIGVQVFGTVFDALVSMGIKPPEKLSMLAGSSPETLGAKPIARCADRGDCPGRHRLLLSVRLSGAAGDHPGDSVGRLQPGIHQEPDHHRGQ